MIYAGLDVHKDQMTYCLLDDAGEVTERGQIACRREAIARFARRLGSQAAVALEATTHSQAIAYLIQPSVQRVVVANPMKVRAIAEARVKTDKVDAEVLAQLLRCDYLPSVWLPDELTRQERQLSGRRTAVINQRTRVINRVHSLLASRLIPLPETKLLSKAGRDWLAQLDLDALDRAELDSELRLIDAFDQEIAHLDQQIAELAYQRQEAKLLMTIPGISQQVAMSLLAAWGDWRRFKSADHAASYLGLVPSTHQSNKRCYHGSITKAGRSHGRMMLVQAAQSMRHQQTPLGSFFRKLARRKNQNVAITATARKMAVIAFHVLQSGEPYRYAPPQSTATKLAQLRIQATGQRRTGGVAKGQVATRHSAQSTRHRPALNEVYAKEQLPAALEPDKLPAGEQRMLDTSALMTRAQQIHASERVPRNQSTKKRGGREEEKSNGCASSSATTDARRKPR